MKNNFKRIKEEVEKFSHRNPEKERNNESALSSFHAQQGTTNDGESRKEVKKNINTSNQRQFTENSKGNNSVNTDKLLLSKWEMI